VQTPEYRISNVNELNETPIASLPNTNAPIPNVLGNVATMHRRPVQSVYNQSNIQPVYDLYASVQNSDLGSVATSLSGKLSDLQHKLKPGNRFVVRGQIEHEHFANLTLGLIFRGLRVSADGRELPEFPRPLAVILALPGAGAGIILMLFVTGTTLTCPRSWAPSCPSASPRRTRSCWCLRP
jgi:multidrug efflux pump subunit AcrB